MTTLSHQQPSLEERAAASTLILVGTVAEGPLSQADYSTDPPQVHSQYHVDVKETLRGRAPGTAVTIRVKGGQVAQLRTEPTSALRPGDRVLLFLAPYLAAEREEEIFVPYFRGCYAVSVDDVVALGGRSTMPLNEVRAYIQAVLQRREQSTPQQDEPDADLPEADLNAMLHVEPGGARWARLDESDKAPSTGG
jgi:hypothetical protein